MVPTLLSKHTKLELCTIVLSRLALYRTIGKITKPFVLKCIPFAWHLGQYKYTT